jgi:hypothetical protein
MLLAVTAADIRAAAALAEQKRRTFGFGWLLKHLEAQALRRRQREIEEREQCRRAEAEEAERRQREQREAAYQALWDDLTDQQREEYCRRAVTPFVRSGLLLERAAQRLAYEERGVAEAADEIRKAVTV